MLKIALAQINVTVGDLAGNARKILEYAAQAQKRGADLAVFGELVLCGYPPEDLLLKEHFIADNLKALDALAKKIRGVAAVVGFVDSDGRGKIYNAAAVIGDGIVKEVYHKHELPNYGVFDEKRYFTPGKNRGLSTVKGVKIGISICEDIWVEGGVYLQEALAKAKVLVNVSSSPYEAGKWKVRYDLLARRARETKTPMVYVNLVGGQDELVFDGASMVVGPDGQLMARARQFEEELLIVSLPDGQAGQKQDGFAAKGALRNDIAPVLEEAEEIYKALVMGTRDYVGKNGFKKVALGLSGGIDSALVACIAVDALGSRNVVGISMPSPFNAKATRADAAGLAKNLGIEFKEIPIKKIFAAYRKMLSLYFKGLPPDMAEENIQARIRGNILMAFANKFGWLVLTTGNKSEMAVGYCTLYGDMSGGYAVIKDVFKTKVYDLVRWRNSMAKNPLIPKSVLLRAPSAELRPDQTDEQTLGAYEDLDKILRAYVEGHAGPERIVQDGLEAKHVHKTIRLVDVNEYKRRQAPPGVKITSRAFGKDWRLPITNKYKE